jgi:hypothetical protein
MQIIAQKTTIDKIIKHFVELDLPLKEYKKISNSTIKLIFKTDFDSIILARVMKENKIEFQETYNFERFSGEFAPIMKELADYGSVNAKKYLDFDEKVFKNTDQVMEIPFFGGSHIGDFSINDTSEIIQLINNKKIPDNLPQDLIFQWSESSKVDSIGLYLIKHNSTERGLNETNIISMSSAEKVRNNPSEYDKNGIPTKWNSEAYYEITLTLDSNGADRFYELTKRNVGEYIAFNLNESIFSAPRVTMPIEGGRISILLTGKQDLIRFYKLILFNDFNGMIKVNRFEMK